MVETLNWSEYRRDLRTAANSVLMYGACFKGIASLKVINPY